MVSSTTYKNQISSFSTAKIIWRNKICIGYSFHGWLFKDWPSDYHDSGVFRTGLGEASHQLKSKQWLIQIGSHPDVDALDAPQVEAGWLWFGTLTTNLHFPSTLFCHISQMDNFQACMMSVFFFLPLDVFELLSTFPQNYIWLWYFSLFWNFWLPLHSRSVLHDYCSIEAGLVQYQVLLKEVMLNQKVVCYSWLMIKTF